MISHDKPWHSGVPLREPWMIMDAHRQLHHAICSCNTSPKWGWTGHGCHKFSGSIATKTCHPNWRFFQLPCEKSAVKEHRHSCDPERPFWSGRAVDIPPWSSVFDMQLWQSKEESGPQSARPQWLRSSLQLIVVFLDWYHLAAVQPQIEDPAGQNQGPGCCEKKINKRIHLWWSSEDATN